jgi:hypothetical protein
LTTRRSSSPARSRPVGARGAARRATAGALAAATLVAGCGGGDGHRPPAPERAVRAAATAYLGALAAGEFPRACRMMTAAARRELADAAGTTCAQALRAGAGQAAEDLASVRREVDGADIRVRGANATIGPFGAAQQPLRLVREQGRWRVAG